MGYGAEVGGGVGETRNEAKSLQKHQGHPFMLGHL